MIFSSSGKKLFDKWQFYKTIHCAVFLDFYIISLAFSPWPFPRETGTTRCPFSSLSLLIWSMGSLPGVKMSRIGWWATLFSKTSFRLMIIGVVKYAPSVFFTNLRIANVVNSGLRRRIKGIQAKWGSWDCSGSGIKSKATSALSHLMNFSQRGNSAVICSSRVS